MQDHPIIDAHLHLWDPARLRYPWLADFSSLRRAFTLDDYRKAVLTYDVKQMVFVQCQCDEHQALDEVACVTEIARQEPRITGIVAWAPLENGKKVADILEILSRNKLVKGIRCPIQHARDPRVFAKSPDLLSGIQLLRNFDFSLDLCIHHSQVTLARDIAIASPDVRIILDHLGKPNIKDQQIHPWRDEISALASLPNVWCKISGMATEADWVHWSPADLKPFLDHVLQSFHPERVLFGGDWPVVTLASPLSRWIDILRQLSGNLSSTDSLKLFHDNAQSVYRLPSRMTSSIDSQTPPHRTKPRDCIDNYPVYANVCTTTFEEKIIGS